MWPRREKTKFPRLARPFSSYLRGRLAHLLPPAEAQAYASDERIEHQVAFALGATTKRRAPIMTEAQLERAVRDRLDLLRLVAEVERDDGPQGGSPPPVPVPLGVEQTATVRWIGEPLPSSA